MGTIATNILTFVLGLAFTLFGMNQMCSGLERLSGGRLETVLSKATDTKSKHPIVGRIKGMLVGCGVTALVQSSSSTTVMTVGFVNSGIMRLEQAIGIIMGANIGTTVTTWLFALTGVSADAWYVQIFTPKVFAPVLALVGIVLLIFSKRQRRRDAGSTLVSSWLSPLLEMASTKSLRVTMPKSPWLASAGCTKKAGVPVEASVAAILRPMWPLLPMPITTTRPGVAKIACSTSTKTWSRRCASACTDCTSIDRVSRAVANACVASTGR